MLERSRPGTEPAVTLIPSITGEDNLRAYYTDHQNYFGFDQCISIYQAVEVNSNGDLALPGLPRLCGGEHQRGHHHRALELPGLP